MHLQNEERAHTAATSSAGSHVVEKRDLYVEHTSVNKHIFAESRMMISFHSSSCSICLLRIYRKVNFVCFHVLRRFPHDVVLVLNETSAPRLVLACIVNMSRVRTKQEHHRPEATRWRSVTDSIVSVLRSSCIFLPFHVHGTLSSWLLPISSPATYYTNSKIYIWRKMLSTLVEEADGAAYDCAHDSTSSKLRHLFRA